MPWLSREAARDLREGLGSLMLCNLGDYVSGAFLHVFRPLIEKAPVIIALLPAASDARGDVYSSYGSRLGSLLHLGLFSRHRRQELETLAAVIVAVNAWIGLLVALLAAAMGRSLDPLDAVFVSLSSAAASAAVMVPATTLLAVKSFQHGLDPDNLVAPIATLFGDMVTIPSIVLGYEASARLCAWAKLAAVAALAALAAATAARILRRAAAGDPAYRRAARNMKEVLGVVAASTLLSSLAGALLLANLETLLAVPGVLVVIPAFLEDGGAIATRFSSRLATKLHLGSLAPSCRATRWVWEQVLVNMAHAAAVFTSLGVMGALAAYYSAAPLGWCLRVLAAVLAAGLVLAAAVSLATYCLAAASFRAGLDPDNVLAPTLTSIADILGTASLVAATLLLLR